jgi:cbb3-type cytochrome oxidase maturation protein
MNDFLYLILIALALGALGLGAFMWALRRGQYEDLAGAAERILLDDADTPARRTRYHCGISQNPCTDVKVH